MASKQARGRRNGSTGTSRGKRARRGRGGARPGPGRKPAGDEAGEPHRPRQPFVRHACVHVRIGLRRGLPSLRRPASVAVVHDSLREANARGLLRVVRFSIQREPLHRLCGAPGRRELGPGIKGVSGGLARLLDELRDREGRLWAGRYRDEVLREPRAVRAALVEVSHDAEPPLVPPRTSLLRDARRRLGLPGVGEAPA